MKSTSLIGLLLLAVACGGATPPAQPAESPSPSAQPPATPSADTAPPAPTDSAAQAPASPPAAATAPPAPPAVIVLAMKFAPAKGKRVIEVKADGSVVIAGKPSGKVTASGVQDEGGNPQLAVGADGSITVPVVPRFKPVLKFSDKDELLVDGKREIWIDDDGTVRFAKADGTPDGKAGGKVDGFDAKGRRAAELLIFREQAVLPVGKKGP